MAGKTIILTTSAGSQGIVSAKKADEILIGSFANAKAIVDYIRSQNPAMVSLVAMGESGMEPALEDEACALYLKEKLEGLDVDFEPLKKEILKGKGAQRLKRLQQEDDLQFCLQLNSVGIVPKVNKTNSIICA